MDINRLLAKIYQDTSLQFQTVLNPHVASGKLWSLNSNPFPMYNFPNHTQTSSLQSPSFKLMCTELVKPSSHLILCRPLLLLPSIFPSIMVFFYWVGSSHQVAKVLQFQLRSFPIHLEYIKSDSYTQVFSSGIQLHRAVQQQGLRLNLITKQL